MKQEVALRCVPVLEASARTTISEDAKFVAERLKTTASTAAEERCPKMSKHFQRSSPRRGPRERRYGAAFELLRI